MTSVRTHVLDGTTNTIEDDAVYATFVTIDTNIAEVFVSLHDRLPRLTDQRPEKESLPFFCTSFCTPFSTPSQPTVILFSTSPFAFVFARSRSLTF